MMAGLVGSGQKFYEINFLYAAKFIRFNRDPNSPLQCPIHALVSYLKVLNKILQYGPG